MPLFLLLVVASNSWRPLAWSCKTPISAFIFTYFLPLCLCVSLSKFLSSYKDTESLDLAHSNPV